MTDRELLEAAARAMGIEMLWPLMKEGATPIGIVASSIVNTVPTFWSPLNDDGDNARLRRALRIVVQWFPTDVAAMHWSEDGRGRSWPEPYGKDPAAAERRAVVRAAAAMASATTA